jgi:hypothetical protein
MFLLVWRLAGRRPIAASSPVLLGSGNLPQLGYSGSENEIVVADKSLTQAQREEMREGLLAHLARVARELFVQRLLSHKKALMRAQDQATADMAELEARLEKIHAPLQERLRAYEQRINELEKDLSQKGEENRELIRAKIQMARRHLELEKAKMNLN